jgi:16S rRNA (guanine527-N7)-methyltransferase
MARPFDLNASLAALVDRFGLPAGAIPRFAAIVDLIARDEHAPTTVREPSRIVDDHIADSLVALELEPVRDARAIVDIGAGAGFPGLPLAIALPHADVVLLDGNGRKCAFARTVAAASGTRNCAAVHARAEEWSDGIGTRDLVTARAVGPTAAVLEYAAPLLKRGGSLVTWQGSVDSQAEVEAEEVAAHLGLALAGRIQVRPYPQATNRYLNVYSKVRDTPDSYPRRAGMALKRPLRTGRF